MSSDHPHKLNPAKSGGFLLIGPYDPALVREIKTLPGFARQWDPDIHAWRIAEGYDKAAQTIIDRHYGGQDGE